MFTKPYHKMPDSSWMIPGGNRDQKKRLMKEQKYPMMSAIQKNLGGPLSEAFFSCLSPPQQDQIGYTPKLKGPGKDLWVSPSDILQGKVVLTVPYTSRLSRAMTHQGIMKMGAEIEARFLSKVKQELDEALLKKEKEMKEEVERLIKEAIEADRNVQQMINNQILERASSDLSKSYQEVLENTVSQVLEEGMKKLEEAVEKTKREMEEELCLAVNNRSDYLSKQYEFQLAWRDSQLTEKYQIKLKKHRQDCSSAMDKVQKEFQVELQGVMVRSHAEHVTDMLVQGAERSEEYHEDKKQMESGFEVWFMKYFDEEIVKRDFAIVELERTIRQLESKCNRREDQLKKVFWHFQKFINFALKEKPGQAEFLLNLQKEMEDKQTEATGQEKEVEFITNTILEYIIKVIADNYKENKNFEKKSWENPNEFHSENFRARLKQEKEKLRLLQVAGEELTSTDLTLKFKKSRMVSMMSLFDGNPSLLPIFSDVMKEEVAL